MIGVDIDKNSEADIIWDLERFPYPFKSKSFDMIVSFEVIEHLWNYEKFLLECNRLLKDKGLLIISTPNRNSLINRIFNSYLNPKYHKGPYAHKYIFSKKELEELLEKSGVKILKIWYKPPKSSAIRKWATIPRKILHYFLPNSLREIMFFKCIKIK